MKHYHTLFAFIALMLAVSLACGIDFGNSTPAASEPSQPPADNTNAGDATPDSSGEKYFTEEFDGGYDDWSKSIVLGSDETNESGLSLETDGGFLVFDVDTKYLFTYLFYEPFDYDNVVVEARVENRGTNNNNISLICRYSDEGWYEFNIANNGLYDILYGSKNDAGEIVYAPIADGGSNKIKSGKDVNEYKIICKERTLSLFINGTETRVLKENNVVLRDGKVGIGVSSFKDLPVKVDVDWVKISQPQ